MRHCSSFRGSRCALVALVVGAAASISCAQPQECQIQIPDCTGIPYLLTGETWKNNTAWKSNRLPGVSFQLMTGNFCAQQPEGNNRGLIEWWCDPDDAQFGALEQIGPPSQPTLVSGVVLLMNMMDTAYEQGFRRFLLYAPAGSVWGGFIDHDDNPNTPRILYGQEYISSSQYWTIPQSKRELLEEQLTDWLSVRTDAQIEVYSSFPLAGNPSSRCMGLPQQHEYYTDSEVVIPTSQCADLNQPTMIAGCAQDCPVYGPSPFLQLDVCLFNENIEPWLALGAQRYWLDSASIVFVGFWGQFTELAHCPLYRPTSNSDTPHLLGAEAFPLDLVAEPAELDMPRARFAPAIGFTEWIRGADGNKSWNVLAADRTTTELVAVLDYSNSWVFENPTTGNNDGVFAILDWARRGFVVYVANPNEAGAAKLIEYVKRVYDMGILTDRRDFNGDGVVNITDWNNFLAQWNLYNGTTTGCNWIHGDVDQDNDVDPNDKLKYTLWYNTIAPPGQQPPAIPVNLGDAEPDDVLTMPN